MADFNPEPISQRLKGHPYVLAFYLFLLVVGGLGPLFTGFDNHFVHLLLLVEVYIILALGLNLVVGWTGLLDLGYVTFLCTGALVVALVSLVTRIPANPAQGTEARYMLPVQEAPPNMAVITGDEHTQLTEPKINFTGPKGATTDDGIVYVKVFKTEGRHRVHLFRDAGMAEGDLIATGSRSSPQGTITFSMENESGVFGKVTLSYEADSDAIRLEVPAQPFAKHFFGLLLLAGLICALIGMLRGIPTLKLTGDYYAIVTLGLAEIVYLFYLNTTWLTGGARTISFEPPVILGQPLYWNQPFFYYLMMGVVVLTILAMYRMQHSRMGRAWAAIHLDETAAKCCGVDVNRYKMIAFAISGFVGGIGGALFAYRQGGTFAIKDLEVWESVVILCCVVLGGMGSIPGTIIGTILLISMEQMLRSPIPVVPVVGAASVAIGAAYLLRGRPLRVIGAVIIGVPLTFVALDAAAGHLTVQIPGEARYLIFGLMLVFLMRFRPEGLVPLVRYGRTPSEAELTQLRAMPTPLFALSGDPDATAGASDE